MSTMAQHLSNPQAKPPSTFAIFIWRMQAEGRETEFRNKLKEIQETTGKKYSPAMWHILKQCPEFGYTTPKAEEEWFAVNREKVLKGEKNAKVAERVRNHRARKAEEQVEKDERSEEEKIVEAIRHLPPTASPQVEYDWFRSHPAFMRKATRTDPAKKIKITVEDILNPPNGSAPSQAAAYMLPNIANAPQQLLKEILSRMMKAAAGEGGGNNNPDAPSEWDNADDDGIKEAEQHLKRIKDQLDSAKS